MQLQSVAQEQGITATAGLEKKRARSVDSRKRNQLFVPNRIGKCMQRQTAPRYLKAEDIRIIRREYELDYTGNAITAVNVIELAKRYGVSQETIRNIAKRRSYAWVSD